MADKVIITFHDHKHGSHEDIEVGLDATAHEFVLALNQVYALGLDVDDLAQCYLACENPIALLRGSQTLRELGLRTGSSVHFKR